MKASSFSSSSLSTSSSVESLSLGSSDSYSSQTQDSGNSSNSATSHANDVDAKLQQQQISSPRTLANGFDGATTSANATTIAAGGGAALLTAPTQHEDGDPEPYERSFWANLFTENSVVDNLLSDETMEDGSGIGGGHHDDDHSDAHGDAESKYNPHAHQHDATAPSHHLDNGALDATSSSSALLDHWSHYDSGDATMDESAMTDFSAPTSSGAPSSNYAMFSHATTFQQQHNIADVSSSFHGSTKPSSAHHHATMFGPLPAAVALRRFAFDTRSDGAPFPLSKPILRDDGILLVGTELADSTSVRDKNRIFVTNAHGPNPGQNAANILVDSEVRDLHWMNHQTAIVAIGKDIHLISIGAVNGSRSCHLQSAIPSVHSDTIRELAVPRSSYRVLSGGFDETVVLTDLRRVGDPTASAVVSKFDAHDVVSSLRWSPDESQMSWTTDGGDFQVGDARVKTPQLNIPLYKYLHVDSMGGLFTHEWISDHKVVLGFEHSQLVYLDTRMPWSSCCYGLSTSPMGATGEIRRSKANALAHFGLGGFAITDLSLNSQNQQVLKVREFNPSTNSAYKTSGDFSFESNNLLAVSDNMGTMTFFNSDTTTRATAAAIFDGVSIQERTV